MGDGNNFYFFNWPSIALHPESIVKIIFKIFKNLPTFFINHKTSKIIKNPKKAPKLHKLPEIQKNPPKNPKKQTMLSNRFPKSFSTKSLATKASTTIKASVSNNKPRMEE